MRVNGVEVNAMGLEHAGIGMGLKAIIEKPYPAKTWEPEKLVTIEFSDKMEIEALIEALRLFEEKCERATAHWRAHYSREIYQKLGILPPGIDPGRKRSCKE